MQISSPCLLAPWGFPVRSPSSSSSFDRASDPLIQQHICLSVLVYLQRRLPASDDGLLNGLDIFDSPNVHADQKGRDLSLATSGDVASVYPGSEQAFSPIKQFLISEDLMVCCRQKRRRKKKIVHLIVQFSLSLKVNRPIY